MQVYSVNLNKLIIWLLPISLRKSKVVSYLVALIKPIQNLYVNFLYFRNQQLYDAEINGQTIKLERVLNDTFDVVERRIYITDGDYFTPPVFYEEYKNLPVIFYEEGNTDNPIYYKVDSIDDRVDFNFYVHVPQDVFFEKPRITALTNKYKIFGRTFDVILIQ